jgi:pimeloyl-ACP methyl ester carboxylesterase
MTAPGTSRQIARPDGARIAYDVAGKGPPVLFLHGLANRRQGWEPVTSLLESSFTCVRIDFRGHGESGPAPDYSMPSLLGDVRAIVDELGLDSPAVVGNSLGANAAAIYAASNPVSAVVCVGQSLLRFGDFALLVQAHARDLQGEKAMQAVLEIDRKLGLEPFDEVEELERRVLAFPPEVVRGLWAQLLSTPPEQLTAISEALLPRITTPLLSLHGAPPPADYGPWLTRLVPTAAIEVWDGMGHLLHLVDPTRFAERLRAFLAQPPG